jgi:hypothetical protein
MAGLFDLLKTDWKKYSLITLLSSGISSLVAYNTTDRDKSLVEMEAYNKYVTEMIVFHKSPENRRKLAEYFSTVSPSFFSRRQWSDYLTLVKAEEQRFDTENKALLDSLAYFREQLAKSKKLSVKDSINYNEVRAALSKNSDIKQENLQSPGEIDRASTNNETVYIQSSGASLTKSETVANTLREAGYKVASIENMSDEKGQQVLIKENQIRYFNATDQERAQAMLTMLKGQLENPKAVYNPRFANAKHIEIWVK